MRPCPWNEAKAASRSSNRVASSAVVGMGPVPGIGTGRAGAHAHTPVTSAARAALAKRRSDTGRRGFRTTLEFQQLVRHALTLVGVFRASLTITIDADGILTATDLHVRIRE